MSQSLKPKIKVLAAFKAHCTVCGWSGIHYITGKGAAVDAKLSHTAWDCADRQEDRQKAITAMREDMYGGADD